VILADSCNTWLSNAAYWYRRARKPVCKTSLDEEWDAIAKTLLSGHGARNGE
jgi:hypothetical protein